VAYRLLSTKQLKKKEQDEKSEQERVGEERKEALIERQKSKGREHERL
jgi:hypothetical protein